MADVTINDLRIAPALGPRTPTTVRAYAMSSFILNDGDQTAVTATSPYNGGAYYKSVALSADGSGYLAADFTLPSTTDSPDNPDGARWGLFVFDGAAQPRLMFEVAGLESFWLEPTPTTVTAEDIRANVLGSLPTATLGDREVTGNLTVGGDLDVGGIITGNGGGLTNIPGTPSGPAFESLEADASLWAKYQADGGGVGRFDILRGDPGSSVFGIDAAGEVDEITLSDDVIEQLAQDVSPHFIVTNYGAVGDDSTDNGAVINTLFDNIATAGKFAAVGFPNGVFRVSLGLQDTGASNSQLVLPKKNGTQLGIKLFGLTPNSNLGVNVSTDGAVIKSTLASGTGSLLSVKTAGTFNRSEITLYIEDLTFRTVANPTNSCLDLRYVMNAFLTNVKVDDGEGYNAVTLPTTSTSYGIRTPANNVVSEANLRNVAVAGFYNGVEWNELADGDDIVVVNCYRALVVPTAFHGSRAGRILLINNRTNITTTTGIHGLRIAQLGIEHLADSGQWYFTQTDIDDSSNYLRGQIGYYVIAQNQLSAGIVHPWVQPAAGTQAGFNVNGGAYVDYHHNFASGPLWRTLTLLNSWVTFGAPYTTPAYTRIRGMVHLRGVIKSGTATAGTVLFTLPVGYRPEFELTKIVVSNGAIGRVTVETDGDVKIEAGSNVYLNLSDISFPAEL